MAEATGEAAVYRVEAGYEFPSETLVVDASEQHMLHALCDIPDNLYGERVDPTFLARRPILLNTDAITDCHPTYGKVHTVHRIEQFAPARLGEPLAMTGHFTAVADAPRGWAASSVWDYRRADGTLVLRVEPDVLMIDPDRAPTRDGRKPSPTAGADAASGLAPLHRKQVTPEKTCAYCEGTRNLIHIDPDYARGFGFRAPIIAGNHTVNFLLEGVFADGVADGYAVVIRFLRPVFWDDAVDILVGRDGAGRIAQVRALNGDGKLLADCAVTWKD